jgi:hypothetical protein
MEENTYIENTLEEWETLESGITNRVTTALLASAVNTECLWKSDFEEIQSAISQELARIFTVSWTLQSIDRALDNDPTLINYRKSSSTNREKANDDAETKQRKIRRMKDAQVFCANLLCDHPEVITDFSALLLKFAHAEIEPILKDNLRMKYKGQLISELLSGKESICRFNFCRLICDQMALTTPALKILKLVVKQLTPVIENRKNGGLARWKSKQ